MDAPHDRAGTEPASQPKHDSGQRTFTVTVPSFDRLAGGVVNAAMLPIAAARQVLPAKKGLPLYLGLGALAAVDVLDWPVAIGIGLGYAVLRRDGGVIGAPAPAAQPGPLKSEESEAPPVPTGQATPTGPVGPTPTTATGTVVEPQPGSMT